ncbi:MAG: T9SS type A sorting domain-containing protein [Chitinivibrionales bacterium]|nr:T9SS type A sorting domain-containing protein [Chitinivibrionales bacterium]
MFAYPGDEEGFVLRSSSVRSKIGFESSRNNLITLKIIVPEITGLDGDNWDLKESVLWISIAQYHKDTPLFYCLDAREGVSAGKKISAKKRSPISITTTAAGISIELPSISRSIVSIHSADGRTVYRRAHTGNSITVPRPALCSGMYIIDVKSDGVQVTRSLLFQNY